MNPVYFTAVCDSKTPESEIIRSTDIFKRLCDEGGVLRTLGQAAKIISTVGLDYMTHSRFILIWSATRLAAISDESPLTQEMWMYKHVSKLFNIPIYNIHDYPDHKSLEMTLKILMFDQPQPAKEHA